MAAKFIALSALYALAFVVGLGVMVFGWGLRPVSWGWIVGGGVFGQVVIALMQAIVKPPSGE